MEDRTLEEQVTEASEVPEAETKTVQEQLAEQVKACLVERNSCENLGSKFDDTAKELGIGLEELIDQVFEIIAGKEEGGYIN